MSQNIGADLAIPGTVLTENDDYALVAIDTKRDENFLIVLDDGGDTISGHGPVTNERVDPDDLTEHPCGEFKSGWRNDLNHYKIKRFSCHLQGCPKCFRIWARRLAEASAGYLWAFAEQYGRKIAHWVLSPSRQLAESLGKNPWKALDTLARKFIDQFGKWNDSVISITQHPRRKKCPVCGEASENGVHCKKCDVDMVWYWSPHLHINTDFSFDFARAVEYTAFENQEDCIFTQVSVPETKEDLASIIAYELGHARYVEGKQIQAIRYCGYSAKNHFRTDKTTVHTDDGEPTINIDGSVDNHTFYKLDEVFSEEAKPGILKVTKKFGKILFSKDLSGKRIALQKTTYYFKLTPLGQWLNGRWVRFTLPRKLPKIKVRKPVFTPEWERKFLNLPYNH